MTVRLIEGQVPYTGGTAIEITADKVINLLLRAENNLLHVNDDNELYCDLQLENGIAVDDDLPVGVTTGIVNESDGRPQNGLLLHYETTSGAYAQRLYGGDGKLYFNGGTGERKLVYYAEDVDELLNQLYNQLVYELTMEAGEGISIVNGKDYSAMRGPCPEGFHIPMKSENDMLYDIVVEGFGLRNFETYLKMPIYGALKHDTGLPFGAESSYISCNAQSLNHCYALGVQSNNVYRNLSVYKSNGQSIRPISDHILKPTQHWTVIYDGSSIAEGAGIFHNPGLGVISLSSDGENWITIADKNLGATTVFNVGDPKTSDNCGGFFQWGNNYMFPSSGATQTDNNKVNASDYGPGNYYTSNTFILTDWTDWDSSNNANLWGGVTGVQNMHNVINNTGVLSVNGRKGHVIVPENVKMFELNDDQDLDNAQKIWDWVAAGNYALLKVGGQDETFVLAKVIPGLAKFQGTLINVNNVMMSGYSESFQRYINIHTDPQGVVLSIDIDTRPFGRFVGADVGYMNSFNPSSEGDPATKKYVDDNVGLRVFQFADWTDLTTGQAAYDWYKSGKLPVLLHNNILYYPFQKSGGWLMFYPLELDHHTAASGHGQYSYYNRIRITINTTNDIVTAINASTRTPYGYRIDPNEDYQDPYMAQYDGSPVTRKYLDGRIISDSTAPASPTEGALWYDTTNDVLKSYDGTNWNIVGDDAGNINTKTFYITNTGSTQADIDEAQPILDWYLDGKNPIVNWNDCIWIMTESRLTGTPKQLYFKRSVPQFSNNALGYGTSLLTDELCINFVDNTVLETIHFNGNRYVDFLETHTDYLTPYEPLYQGSPTTKKYVDDFLRIFPLGGTTPQDAQPILDWILAGHKAAINYNGSIYLLASQSSQNLVFYDMNFDIRKNTNGIFSDLMYSQILIQYSTDTVTSVMASRTSRGGSFLTIDANYSGNFLPLVDGDPTNKYYVDKLGPCVPVYHLGGGNVMTSYINFDMAGGTYKVKIQGYHGTTINRTITVTASSALAGTFTSNLIEHYNYGCIVTIDPSVSTTMIIQIDSNSNFTVDDIYIEKINIQSGIVTATSIN